MLFYVVRRWFAVDDPISSLFVCCVSLLVIVCLIVVVCGVLSLFCRCFACWSVCVLFFVVSGDGSMNVVKYG